MTCSTHKQLECNGTIDELDNWWRLSNPIQLVADYKHFPNKIWTACIALEQRDHTYNLKTCGLFVCY